MRAKDEMDHDPVNNPELGNSHHGEHAGSLTVRGGAKHEAVSPAAKTSLREEHSTKTPDALVDGPPATPGSPGPAWEAKGGSNGGHKSKLEKGFSHKLFSGAGLM